MDNAIISQVKTFIVLLAYAPCFFFVGLGFYLLFTGLFRLSGKKGWTSWKIYDGGEALKSWWVGLGWAKPARIAARGELNERKGVWLSVFLGTFFLLIGIAGIALITVIHRVS